MRYLGRIPGKSMIATRFRIWATGRLREYIVKGFVMDDERLKNPPVQGSAVPDYFDEMLERIRDIRASERRMYLRVREIFAMAGDYDPDQSETMKFFQIIQNKLHFAATGMTAAELIASRADHQLPNMGLTSWKGDVVRKTDVVIAKNYLKEKEIDRTEPYCRDVAGFCRRSGETPKTGLYERLAGQTG